MLTSSIPALMPEYPNINRNTADQKALVLKPTIMADEIHREVFMFQLNDILRQYV